MTSEKEARVGTDAGEALGESSYLITAYNVGVQGQQKF